MRKALIVGIDFYDHIGHLTGCVSDALSVKGVLERNADGGINFGTPKVLTATSAGNTVRRTELKEAVRSLFADDSEIALFYFAGHGHVEDTGGFLCASDCLSGDDGLSMTELMTLATNSPAKNKILVLDSCYSGVAGTPPGRAGTADICEGMTILTASTATQYASEVEGGGAGVYTTLFVDALEGAAANLVGDITPGSVYAHIDQSLGSWAQRPVFKTNVKGFVSLRRAQPPIPLEDLRLLPKLFPEAGFSFQLDPAFEPERAGDPDPSIPPPDPEKNRMFATLQKFVKVNLVRPVDAPHMWHAAMGSKSCQLTVLGEHYRKLIKANLL